MHTYICNELSTSNPYWNLCTLTVSSLTVQQYEQFLAVCSSRKSVTNTTPITAHTFPCVMLTALLTPITVMAFTFSREN